MNINLKEILDPLDKKDPNNRNKKGNLPLCTKAYLPFALAAVLLIIKGINGRWFVGVGLILNLIGSILLFVYNDDFTKFYAATFNSNDKQSASFQRTFLENDAKMRSKYALSYLIFGFMLQSIGLWVDP